jgi:hypothetical protein
MIKFLYSNIEDEKIIKHEEVMLKEFNTLIESYKDKFSVLGCVIDFEICWLNSAKNVVSNVRIPFSNGYICGISLNILYNGQVICLNEEDGNSLTLFWNISSVMRVFFHLNVTLLDDLISVEQDLIEYLIEAEKFLNYR